MKDERIFHVLSGRGIDTLFLFGLNLMRESLIKLNNEKLKKVLEKATGSKFRALVTGVFATILVQSSSGVTAVVVALICAGLLTLSQGLMVHARRKHRHHHDSFHFHAPNRKIQSRFRPSCVICFFF